jgi:hypothetical protein
MRISSWLSPVHAAVHALISNLQSGSVELCKQAHHHLPQLRLPARPRGALVAAVTLRARVPGAAIASGRGDLSLSGNGQRRGEGDGEERIASGKGCREEDEVSDAATTHRAQKAGRVGGSPRLGRSDSPARARGVGKAARKRAPGHLPCRI